MRQINEYIFEKLIINDKVSTKDSINDKYVKALKNYCKDIGINFNSWEESIRVGDSKKYIIITLKYKKHLYNKIMSFVNNNYPISKPCATNNQSIYIYPDYNYVDEK